MTKIFLQTSFENDLYKEQNHKKSKLFSYTQPIDFYDPVEFFTYQSSTFHGKRFFWKSSDEQLWTVGLGIAATISVDDAEERFQDSHTKWNQLLKDANIENPARVPGTGPLLFGGFSFDPYSEIEDEWEAFGHSILYLPSYMLTVTENQTYLTINAFSNNTVSAESLREEANKLVQQLKNDEKLLKENPIKIKNSIEIAPDKWIRSVDEIVNILKTTDTKKVVFARKLLLEFEESAQPSYIIKKLLEQQPDSFVFALEVGDYCFLGASPERLIKKIDHDVLSTCLAGSIGRGKDIIEDQKLGEMLLHDHKNLFEHELVVSMIEDALRPYCTDINIPAEPVLMKMPDIQHLYTPVRGKANEDFSILNVVENLHPTPALGGVPTKAALSIIREKEHMDRGFYAGPIGWTDYKGNGEFAVGIRSGLINRDKAYLYAGCGLVSDSVSEEELKETRIKFQPMLKATGGEIL
ncbi:isochorismate synthase MenF [Lederbergia wuyishanensis]|uniref:isochorismate synthase n=1 Tax=Lederbergia wuyishanensis TaxID=1347903 RepID=A0ABU0D4R6_9BACI|nr:isochorismate synthase [Lederbergia wuyishanensis]MCJ8009498.1 isochorismate synthase [Lederbergia wuyishanensis]MDQ0343403.1 menaquinone-specific isochorismate synthase [Lederbergia wuyishanensis]